MRKLLTIGLLAMTAIAGATAIAAGAHAPGVNGPIAYDRRDPGTDDSFVLTVNSDGSHALQLRGHAGVGGWSHDGGRLAIVVSTDDGRVGTTIVRPDGSGEATLPIADPTLNVACGAWSPDDARLACAGWDDSNPARSGIYTLSSSDGSGLARLTNPLGGDDQLGSYSPDGKRLEFARFDSNHDFVGLFVAKIATGHLRQITPPGTLVQDGNGGDWSPQGNEIVFSRHVTADVRGSIWVVHSDGSRLHEIPVEGLACGSPRSDPTGYGCHGTHWSPDGTKIVFGANTQTGRDIYTVNADGTGLTQITHDGDDDDPAWGAAPSSGR